jgi:hypothetical protein
MNLTKQIKEQLVIDLVAEACKKHAMVMGQAAIKLNNLWEALVVKEAELLLPELSRERWLDLIQQGTMVAHASNGTLSVYMYEHKEDVENPNLQYSCRSKLVMAKGPAYPSKHKDERSTFLSAIMRNWSTFGRVFGCRAANYGYEIRFDPSFPGVPAVRHTKTVYQQAVEPRPGDPVKLNERQLRFSQAAWPLVKTANDLAEKFAKVIEEAEQMQKMLTQVIMPMKTARQLLDVMPEAGKHLPEPVAKKQELAPKDLVDKARRMLAEGIPT